MKIKVFINFFCGFYLIDLVAKKNLTSELFGDILGISVKALSIATSVLACSDFKRIKGQMAPLPQLSLRKIPVLIG